MADCIHKLHRKALVKVSRDWHVMRTHDRPWSFWQRLMTPPTNSRTCGYWSTFPEEDPSNTMTLSLASNPHTIDRIASNVAPRGCTCLMTYVPYKFAVTKVLVDKRLHMELSNSSRADRTFLYELVLLYRCCSTKVGCEHPRNWD